jgi:predicted DNA-binding transcriptional regulator AlpA
MGKTKFLELVDNGTIPRPTSLGGIRIWDRFELDAAFEAAKEAGEPSERNSFDKIFQLNR